MRAELAALKRQTITPCGEPPAVPATSPELTPDPFAAWKAREVKLQ